MSTTSITSALNVSIARMFFPDVGPMSCCQAARHVPRDFFFARQGKDDGVSPTMKIQVVAPIRYGLENLSPILLLLPNFALGS